MATKRIFFLQKSPAFRLPQLPQPWCAQIISTSPTTELETGEHELLPPPCIAKLRENGVLTKDYFGMKYRSLPGPSGIKNFQSRDFRDGILQNPGIPGFFGTGLA